MFLIDIPFKGCQGRSNRSSIVHAVTFFACGVNDTAFTMHAVSLTLNAFLILFAYHHCFAYDFHFSKLFEKFFVHAVSMTRAQDGCFDEKKPRVENLVTLSL
jgi:hypothetical protein